MSDFNYCLQVQVFFKRYDRNIWWQHVESCDRAGHAAGETTCGAW